MNENLETLAYANVIIRLLQGVVYNDDKDIWISLYTYRDSVIKHFSGIGIEVLIDDNEGYAFLKPKELPEEQKLPTIFEKRHLIYPITLLLVLLREKLLEFDSSSRDESRLIMERSDIKDMMSLFLPEGSNEAKNLDKIDTHLNKLIEYGFLRKLKNDENKFEIRRIIKAKVDAEFLQDIKQRLLEHANQSGI